MERREPSTLPVYSKANLKPPFTSMQSSQKTSAKNVVRKLIDMNNQTKIFPTFDEREKGWKMCNQRIRKGQRSRRVHNLQVVINKLFFKVAIGLPFLSELYFSPYSIMVAIFVLIPLNIVPQGRKKHKTSLNCTVKP
jgi:hypothetical protein